MRLQLRHAPIPEGVLFTIERKGLLGKTSVIPANSWAEADLGVLSSPVALLLRALDEAAPDNQDDAYPVESEPAARFHQSGLLLTHGRIAHFGHAQALMLGLPPVTPYCLSIQSRGIMSQNDFRLDTAWLTPKGIRATGTQRVGSMLRHQGVWQRLPHALHALASAIDVFNMLPHDAYDERRKQLSCITAALPQQARDRIVRDGYLDSLRVYHAAAMSLRLTTTDGQFDFEPVLFGRSWRDRDDADDATPESTTDAPPLPLESEALLPQTLHERFVRDLTQTYLTARSSYVLGENRYIYVEPMLRDALDMVRELRGATNEIRRDFARTPQRYLRERLGDAFGEDAVEAMFVVTQEYSERVIGLGVWEPKVLPWIERAPNTWIPERYGIKVEQHFIAFENPQAVSTAIAQVQAAINEDRPSILLEDIAVPANQSTLDTLTSIANLLPDCPAEEAEQPTCPPPDDQPQDRHGPIFIDVADNFEETQYCSYRQRPQVPSQYGPPHALRTSLKGHQREAFAWLIDMWSDGYSGTLLADDMGLGKTLTTLTFLSWLQQRRRELGYDHKPLLIVAPTSLIGNWACEAATHLDDQGLGPCLSLHGSQLRTLRQAAGRDVESGSTHLDIERIRQADWVVTTYETLRDYHHSLACIPWAAVVFDEMQKAKNPTSQITRAVNVLSSEFCLGLTGTPIENSLADIWCIMDTLLPGFLGDLKAFLQQYDGTGSTLKELKDRLEGDGNRRFRPMLRRMKTDTLDGLPAKNDHVKRSIMPDRQEAAYEKALREHAASGEANGLRLLQTLRMISLHPEHPAQWMQAGDDYIGWSARLHTTINLLDDIHQRGEKVLIFLESLDLQDILSIKIKERFGLRKLPSIINGSVPGPVRQRYVQAFQDKAQTFDVMILSPKAGGTGLTLTAANHVIHLTRWWNPAVEDQCTDRIYRIGQTKDVHVYYPLAIHRLPHLQDYSFDLRLHELLERKRAMSREVLLPPVDGHEEALLSSGVLPGHYAAASAAG